MYRDMEGKDIKINIIIKKKDIQVWKTCITFPRYTHVLIVLSPVFKNKKNCEAN